MSVLGRGSVFAVAFAAVLGAGVLASAQQRAPSDVIAARETSMKSLGKEMKAIGDGAKAGSITKEDATAHAKKIADLAGQMGTWFPAGTGPEAGVKTRALPAIWQKPDDFKAALDRFHQASAKLVAAAETGNASAIAAAHGEVGRSCGGCHNPFRLKE
jgi:cytochrome c556